MEPLRRVTKATVEVLVELLASAEPIWGLRIIKETQRHPGTIYPILERLEAQGWATSTWEEAGDRSGPRRRFYSLTPEGRVAALETVRAHGARGVVRPARQGVTP